MIITKRLKISIFALLFITIFLFNMGVINAVTFNPLNPIDPFCLFSCDDDENKTSIQNTTNINNSSVNIGVQTANAQSYVEPLNVSCYPVQTSGYTGQSISWRSSVYGGNGNYSYSWSGTDGLSGTSAYIEKAYTNSGTKSASVTVSSGNQNITRQCSSISIYSYNDNYYNNDNYNYNYYNDYYRYYNYPQLTVSCRANETNISPRSSVTWYASVNGGNGNYSYYWSGTDNLYGSQSYVNKYYDISGQKYANVTVYSNGQQASTQCSNSVYVNYQDNYYNNNYYYPQTIYQYQSNPVNNIQVACYASETSANTGDPVTWNVETTGGYINSYSWKGSEGLSGNQSSVVINYLLAGDKTASVTVYTTNGQSVSKACSNKVKVKDSYSVNSVKKNTSYTPKNVTTPPKSEIKKDVDTSIQSLFSLNNVPWAWVSVLVIAVLVIIIMYLIINKKHL